MTAYHALVRDTDWNKSSAAHAAESPELVLFTSPPQTAAEETADPVRNFFNAAKNAQAPQGGYKKAWTEKVAPVVESSSNMHRLTEALLSCTIVDALENPGWTYSEAEKIFQRLFETDFVDWDIPARRRAAHSALRFEWRLACAVPPETGRKAECEKKLKCLFYDAGFSPDLREAVVPRLGHIVDLSFSRMDYPVYIELDGDTHFIHHPEKRNYPLRYNGCTWLQTQLITQLDPDAVLIRIPYTVLKKPLHVWASDKPRIRFAKAVMAGAEQLYPGAYDLRFGEDGRPVLAPIQPVLSREHRAQPAPA